ncbi:hypothetical protein FPRO05_10725 [Fusarium proliferatum]|uniref:CCHC-type domain-containing protein n=1 Tax=Gibberella intermedia TaxID=948311 RepID=A0A365NC94_GIBIN|nr:hypothetical protein FPRO05_10725 [Fusarium proliferatum]
MVTDSGPSRPGHDQATPSDDAGQQQATREENGESSGPRGNNSTNNRGNRGNRGAPFQGGWSGPRGGRANRGGRGGYHGRQTDHRAQAPKNPPLALVTKSSQAQVAEPGGEVASRLSNNSLKGGNTHHWYSPRPMERLWGETRGGGVDDLIEDVKKRTGAKSVQFFLVPNIEGQFEQVAAKAVERTWEDNNGYNDKGKPAGILRHGVKIDSETKKPTKCAACGNKAHIVANCFSKLGGKDGEQSGCPLCDTNQHHGGDCKEIAALPLPEQVKMLIVNRGNMAPFKGKKSWWKLLHEYCTSPQFDPKLLTAVPWSKEFTLALAKGRKINDMQLRHDTKPSYTLPRDEAFADLTSIYWKYWQQDNLEWPAALGNLPARPSATVIPLTEALSKVTVSREPSNMVTRRKEPRLMAWAHKDHISFYKSIPNHTGHIPEIDPHRATCVAEANTAVPPKVVRVSHQVLVCETSSYTKNR